MFYFTIRWHIQKTNKIMKKSEMVCTGFELQEVKDGRPRQIHWAMCVIFFYFKSVIKKMINDRRGDMERLGFEPLISGVRSNNLSSETLTKDLWFLRLEIEWQLRDNKTQILRFNSKQSACSAPSKSFYIQNLLITRFLMTYFCS